MDQRIAEVMKAAFGDQGGQVPAADHSQHIAITFNGDISIQVTVLKNNHQVTKR